MTLCPASIALCFKQLFSQEGTFTFLTVQWKLRLLNPIIYSCHSSSHALPLTGLNMYIDRPSHVTQFVVSVNYLFLFQLIRHLLIQKGYNGLPKDLCRYKTLASRENLLNNLSSAYYCDESSYQSLC